MSGGDFPTELVTGVGAFPASLYLGMTRKKISEIFSARYGEDNTCCEPSPEEIEKAVCENDLEKRGFQEHRDELIAEWKKLPIPERYEEIRKYHARRTAFFVVNGWDDQPIKLKKDGREVSDGSHRLRAAIHCGAEEVDVEGPDP